MPRAVPRRGPAIGVTLTHVPFRGARRGRDTPTYACHGDYGHDGMKIA